MRVELGTSCARAIFHPRCCAVCGIKMSGAAFVGQARMADTLGNRQGEGASLDDIRARVGHPTEGVFMKCWRCQETRRLEYDGTGGFRCPECRETLIPLEGQEPLQRGSGGRTG